jgi:hypothetical protein
VGNYGGGEMRIQTIVNQHRRDFTAIYVCGHCKATRESDGYDDDNFHRNVIPKMICKNCGLAEGDDYRPMGTKYAAHEVV